MKGIYICSALVASIQGFNSQWFELIIIEFLADVHGGQSQ